MRVISEDLDAEVAGTSIGDRLEVAAWRDGGELRTLQVQSWSVSWDATRSVQGQLTVVVSDPDGDLAPWGMGDLLAPGGSRLIVAWVSGQSGMRIPWGRWLIRGAEPSEVWRIGRDARRIHGGGSITIRADEEPTAMASVCRLDAEIPTTATCLSEIRRLMLNVGCSTVVDPSIKDKPIPAELVYEESRIDAIEDHISRLDAVHRMGIDGSLEIAPIPTVPVWTLAGGDGGVLVGVQRSLSDEDMYNGFVSKAEVEVLDTRVQVVGRAYIDSGPLAWGGPFGRRPLFHESPATTEAGVHQDARTLRDNRQRLGEIVVPVECLMHPALEVHDVVTVMAPTVAGDAPLTGRVTNISMQSVSGAGATPGKRASLQVATSTQTLEAIARRING